MIQIAVSGIYGKTGGELISSAEKNKNFKLYRNMGVLCGLIIIIILL